MSLSEGRWTRPASGMMDVVYMGVAGALVAVVAVVGMRLAKLIKLLGKADVFVLWNTFGGSAWGRWLAGCAVAFVSPYSANLGASIERLDEKIAVVSSVCCGKVRPPK